MANRQMKSRQGASPKVKLDAISDTSSSPGGGGGAGIRARGIGVSEGGVGGKVHRHYTADVTAPPRQKNGSRSSCSTSKSPPGLLRSRLQINLLPRRERSSSSSAGERSSGSSAGVGDLRRRNRDRPSLEREKGHEDGQLRTNVRAEKRQGEVNSHSREASSISCPNQAISGAKPHSIGEGGAVGARGGGGGGAPRRFRQGRSSSAAGYGDAQEVGMEERLSAKQRSILSKMELSVRSRHLH